MSVFNKLLFALVAIVAIAVLPITSPVTVQAAGDVASPVVQLLQSFLNHLLDFQDEILQQLNVGWIAPATVVFVGIAKSTPVIRKLSDKSLQTIVVVVLTAGGVYATKIGFGAEFEGIMPHFIAIIKQVTNPTTIGASAVTVGLGEVISTWLYRLGRQHKVSFAYSRNNDIADVDRQLYSNDGSLELKKVDSFSNYP